MHAVSGETRVDDLVAPAVERGSQVGGDRLFEFPTGVASVEADIVSGAAVTASPLR